MARRFNQNEPGPDRRAEEPRPGSGADETGQFALEESHERRILSWSPDPDEDLEDETVELSDRPHLEDEVHEQARVAAERPNESVLQPSPVEAASREQVPLPQLAVGAVASPPGSAPRELHVGQAAPAEPAPAVPARSAAYPENPPAGQEPRRRGRPRGRPRRQVHFHVDPDEELLLLAAAQKNGSQQKGLVAALQALQDNEILRDEIERLRTECERQRMLLADAEAIFKR